MSEITHDQFGLLMEKLEGKIPVRILSFGEGCFSFMLDRESNSPREVYSEQIRNELLDILEWAKRPNIYLRTLLGDQCRDNRYHKFLDDNYLELKDLKDAKIFYDLIRGIYEKKPTDKEMVLSFIRFLRGKSVTIVGGKHLRKIQPYLNSFIHIETPTLGATLWADRIEKDIIESPRTDIYLFHCGIVGNALIHRLSDQLKDSHLIDVGAFWDLLLGIGTRKEPKFDYPLIEPREL